MMNFLLPQRMARPVARPVMGQGDQLQPTGQQFGPAPAANPIPAGSFNYSGASPGVGLGSLLPQRTATPMLPQSPAAGPAPVLQTGPYQLPGPHMPSNSFNQGVPLSSLLSRMRRGAFSAF